MGKKQGSAVQPCPHRKGTLSVWVYTEEARRYRDRKDVEIEVVPKAAGQPAQTKVTDEKGIAAFELAPGQYTVNVGLESLPLEHRVMGEASENVRLAPGATETVWFVVERILPPIHFVWYGTGDPSPQNTATPGSILEAIPAAKIHYWCLRSKVAQFKAALPARVRVRAIPDLLNALPQNLSARVDGVLRFYLQHRAFAPAKDLVTFLVMAAEGGYFFDANCDFDYAALEAELESNRALPAFVAMADDHYYDPDGLADLGIDELLWAHLMETGPRCVQFRQTDMWAMFGPPGGSPAFREIATHYVALAEKFGIVAGHVPQSVGQEDILRAFVERGGAQRRSIAGTLGTHSIFAGMYMLQQGGGYDPLADSWATRNEGAEYWIDAIGLHKKHGGSW